MSSVDFGYITHDEDLQELQGVLAVVGISELLPGGEIEGWKE